jgi:hypothetical protein
MKIRAANADKNTCKSEEKSKGRVKTNIRKLGKIFATALFMALPLISNCATAKKNNDKIISCEITGKDIRCWDGNEEEDKQEEQDKQEKSKEQEEPQKEEPTKKECSIEVDEKGTLFTTKNGSILLNVPENIDMKKEKIEKISCQANRTIILTENYIIRTLGYNNIRITGLDMPQMLWLGNIAGKKFYFQNAVFISLSEVKKSGEIIDKNIVDGEVVITVKEGNNIKIVIVNTDKPDEPATVK